MNPPSIFNDAIGPVMRGPSSSHCAAALRIGRIARSLMNEDIESVLVEFDPNGSLVTTHDDQGSDMGLFSGLLGYEAHDARLITYHDEIEKAGIKIDIQYISYGADHPNTYKLTLKNSEEDRELTAISTGGGMIEVISIEGAKVNMTGDFFETLVFCKDNDTESILSVVNSSDEIDEACICESSKGRSFVNVKSQRALSEALKAKVQEQFDISDIKELPQVLPVHSRKELKVPFSTSEEMLEYNKGKDLELWELAVAYESARGNISSEEVIQKMEGIIEIMSDSIASGLKGTEYEDRILGCQSKGFQEKLNTGSLLQGGMLNRIILYITAMMEVKSSMGVIVAAPTAGSCGALPGTCIAAGHELEANKTEIAKAMLAAGLIGVFIAHKATFAAEVAGCQAECGSGASMAAASLITLAGGNLEQALTAASLALQNSLGMVCDPIGNRVEAPCLGKNVMAGSNALSSSNMALSNFDGLIPLDQVITTMLDVGNAMPHELRCTNLGGLSITPAAQAIGEKLKANKCGGCKC